MSSFTTDQPDWTSDAAAAAALQDQTSDTPDDPFAQSSRKETANDEPAPTVDPFSSFAEFQQQQQEREQAAAAASSSGAVVPASASNVVVASPPSPVAPRLTGSAEYIAQLEKRLAKVHTRRPEQPGRSMLAGSEFFVTTTTSTSSAAAHAAASRHHALSNPNASSWLGHDGPEEEEDDEAEEAKKAAYLGEPMEHSSDEEADADHMGSAASIEPSIEEQVSLLDQHDQVMLEETRIELEHARAGVHEGDTTASVDLPVSTTVAAGSSSSTTMREMTGPTSHQVESSDGDDTAAPSHTHSTTGAGAASTGVLPHRMFFYTTQTCLAQVANWWEEEERCVIS